MKERGMLFSGSMALANVEGRKTVTRRLVKGHDFSWVNHVEKLDADKWKVTFPGAESGDFLLQKEEGELKDSEYMVLGCPYGKIGDRIYQKETFFEEVDPLTIQNYSPPRYHFKAGFDGPCVTFDEDGGIDLNKDGTEKSPWRSSLFMPKWASRFVAEIVDLRIEQVQELTEEDALKEGVDSIQAYRDLWNSLNMKPKPVKENGKVVSYISYPWDIEEMLGSSKFIAINGYGDLFYRDKPLDVIQNPYVWRIEYKEVKE